MSKVNFFDPRIREIYLKYAGIIGLAVGIITPFVDIPKDCELAKVAPLVWVGADCKTAALFPILVFLAVTYFYVWCWANRLKRIEIDIEGSSVTIAVGDIFKQADLKVIAFNEYFDTQVDDKIISTKSLNGIFVNTVFKGGAAALDNYIEGYPFQESDVIGENDARKVGKKKRYKLGTICVHDEYLLAAFSKFNEKNEATLTMPEYLEFLINFWDSINTVYGQRSVAVTIFGSGITRIKGHKAITDEDLLKIMLWTFRISEMRFKHPAKLTIVINKDKIDKINLLDIETVKHGI